MDLSRKYLKQASILVLLFTALTCVRMLVELFVIGIDVDPGQTGSSHEIILVATIVLCVINFAILIPQVFVGVRGLKIAKTPAATKGHIVWAVILLVLAIMGVFSPIHDIVGKENVVNNVFTLVDHTLDVIVYIMYIKYANKVLLSV